MKTYQLIEKSNGLAKIITYPPNTKPFITLILSKHGEVRLLIPHIFKFLLGKVFLEKIDPFLAASILKDYSYIFKTYSSDKLDFRPLLDSDLEKFKLEQLNNIYQKMKENPTSTTFPLEFADRILAYEQYPTAIFIYKTLAFFCVDPNWKPFKQKIDNIINTILKSGTKIFNTPYELSQYQSTYKLSRNSMFTSVINPRVDQEDLEFAKALALSLETYEMDKSIYKSQQALEHMTVKHEPLLFSKGLTTINTKDLIDAINLPENYLPGTAVDDGGCFFDSLGQILNLLHNTSIYTEAFLRKTCFEYYIYNSQFVNQLHESDYNNNRMSQPYKTIIQTAASHDSSAPIWGRSHIEGRILCLALTEKILPAIHVVEFFINLEDQKYVPAFCRYTKNGQEGIDPNNFYIEKVPILILTQEDRHYIPMIPILEEENNLSQAISMSLQ